MAIKRKRRALSEPVPAWAVASIAVMKSSRTAKAHGLIPSRAPAAPARRSPRGLGDQGARHRGVAPPAAAHVAVEGVLAGFLGSESGIGRAQRLSDDVDAELVDRPLMLAAAVGVVLVVQAGRPD